MGDTFGFDEFIDALGDLEEDFERASIKLLEDTGDLAVAEAQMRTPVDTGALRREMTRSDVKDLEVEVGNPIAYARYVESGTRHQKPSHMLRDGVTIARKYFDKESEKMFEEVTKGFKL